LCRRLGLPLGLDALFAGPWLGNKGMIARLAANFLAQEVRRRAQLFLALRTGKQDGVRHDGKLFFAAWRARSSDALSSPRMAIRGLEAQTSNLSSGCLHPARTTSKIGGEPGPMQGASGKEVARWPRSLKQRGCWWRWQHTTSATISRLSCARSAL